MKGVQPEEEIAELAKQTIGRCHVVPLQGTGARRAALPGMDEPSRSRMNPNNTANIFCIANQKGGSKDTTAINWPPRWRALHKRVY